FAVKRSGGSHGRSMWESAEIRVYRISLLPDGPGRAAGVVLPVEALHLEIARRVARCRLADHGKSRHDPQPRRNRPAPGRGPARPRPRVQERGEVAVTGAIGSARRLGTLAGVVESVALVSALRALASPDGWAGTASELLERLTTQDPA